MVGQQVQGRGSTNSIYLIGANPFCPSVPAKGIDDLLFPADSGCLLRRQAELWAEHGCSEDLLLRGDALGEAESWGAGHGEGLTLAERDLLEQSQELRASEKRAGAQGRFARAFACLLALACLIAVRSALQSQHAIRTRQQDSIRAHAQLTSVVAARATAGAVATSETDARRRAEVAQANAVSGRREILWRAQTAESEVLAAWALSLAEGQPELATLLAVESVRRAPSGLRPGSTTPRQGMAALYKALGQPQWEAGLEDASPAYLPAWRSSAGDLLGTAPGGRVCVWDAETGRRKRCLYRAESDPFLAAWSHDGRYCLTSHLNAKAAMWEVGTGRLMYTLDRPAGWVYFAGWSTDDQMVLTCGAAEGCAVLDALTQEELLVTGCAPGDVMRAEWHSGDSRLAISFADGSTATWDTASGTMLSLARSGQDAGDAKPARTGPVVLVAHVRGSERIMLAESGELMALGCDRVGRNLTREEWIRYVGADVPYRGTCKGSS